MRPLKIHELSFKLMEIRDYCKKNCRSLQSWPSYFDRRYLEFLSYLSLIPERDYNKILELGCGIGYQSAMLSLIANQVFATDLPVENIATHTPGMIQAGILHRQLNIQNVKLVGCSAEAIPFEDDSFDMVYSSHVLEHIPELDKAVSEIYRVLKPGGIHFFVVPASFDKGYSFINYYVYLFKRSIHHLFKKIVKSKHSPETELNTENSSSRLSDAFKQQLKFFPFPPPHGYSNHFLSELKSWTASKWKKRILKIAPFQFISQSTTQFNPILPLFGEIKPVWGTAFHSLTRNAELKWGKLKLLQLFGINTVIVLQKPIQ